MGSTNQKYAKPKVVEVATAVELLQRRPTGGATDRGAKRQVVAASKTSAKKKSSTTKSTKK